MPRTIESRLLRSLIELEELLAGFDDAWDDDPVVHPALVRAREVIAAAKGKGIS